MAYATYTDVEDRMARDLSASEQALCTTLLADAGVLIDTFNVNADAEAKKIVSCRIVIRALSSGDAQMPMGATQGSMSALGYSQSWTMGDSGAVGQLYLDKTDKKYLGYGARLGSSNPFAEMVGVCND